MNDTEALRRALRAETDDLVMVVPMSDIRRRVRRIRRLRILGIATVGLTVAAVTVAAIRLFPPAPGPQDGPTSVTTCGVPATTGQPGPRCP